MIGHNIWLDGPGAHDQELLDLIAEVHAEIEAEWAAKAAAERETLTPPTAGGEEPDEGPDFDIVTDPITAAIFEELRAERLTSRATLGGEETPPRGPAKPTKRPRARRAGHRRGAGADGAGG